MAGIEQTEGLIILYVVSVGLDGLGFRGIVDPRVRILVVLLQSVGRKEPLEDRPQAALVPGIGDPATICDLQCVRMNAQLHYGLC